MPRYFHFFMTVALGLSAFQSANAIEAGSEAAFLKLITLKEEDPINPDTDDIDGNGIIERAQFRLLDAVLRDSNAPGHVILRQWWNHNHLQSQQDNPLGGACAVIELLYGVSCDDIERT